MALDPGVAIADGFQRSRTYTGRVLMGLLFVFQLVVLASLNTVLVASRPAAGESARVAFLAPIPTAVAVGIVVVGIGAGSALAVAAARALTRPLSELQTLPSAVFTRRIGWAALSALGAAVVTTTAIVIGFVILIIPGVYLAISFLFVVFAIGVEDASAFDAIPRSWELASGNRWSLLVVFLVVAVASIVASELGAALAAASPVAGQVVSIALLSVVTVVNTGIVADAYIQLRTDGTDGTAAGSPAEHTNPL